MDLLAESGHRPWPLPTTPWIMTQTWHNLLFAHWPLPPEAVRPLLPGQVTLDTFDGHAWVGVVAFRMTGIRLRGFPEISLVSHFPEINVRTYVRVDDKPGVYFLSLDTDNRAAIALARPWFRLAYVRASIGFTERAGTVDFVSRRTEQGASEARFSALYRPTSEPFRAQAGTLDQWLIERYCYYAVTHRGDLFRCEIHHPAWALQHAEATIDTNTMALSHGIQLPAISPVLHYAHYMRALIWPVMKLAGVRQPAYERPAAAMNYEL